MIEVSFEGGPLNGTIKELDSPPELIIPRGVSLDAVMNFIGGKDKLTCEYYELDDRRSTYLWRKPKKVS